MLKDSVSQWRFEKKKICSKTKNTWLLKPLPNTGNEFDMISFKGNKNKTGTHATIQIQDAMFWTRTFLSILEPRKDHLKLTGYHYSYKAEPDRRALGT